MEKKLCVNFLLFFIHLFCEARHGLEQSTVAHTPEKKAAGINVDLATFMQRHHLQELFSRYGENNTLTVEGFRKLLWNMGIEKIQNIAIDHEHHHHHHHNHVTLNSNVGKTSCPGDDLGGGTKDLQNSHTKDLPETENTEHQEHAVDSKSATVTITASTYATTTDSNLLHLHPETAEVKSPHPGFVSPNPNIVLEVSNVSLLANGKANESLPSVRQFEKGSYMYSKIRKQNTQEVRLYADIIRKFGVFDSFNPFSYC